MLCRYLVFGYRAYEINGMDDCIGQTWIYKKALKKLIEYRKRNLANKDYYIIYDLFKNQEIYNKDERFIFDCCGNCNKGKRNINSSRYYDWQCTIDYSLKDHDDYCSLYSRINNNCANTCK